MEEKKMDDQAPEQEVKKHFVKTPKVTITASDDKDIWNADWIITLTKDESKKIGTFSFAGEKVLGTIPIHVELDEAYRNQGYGTEVIAAMTDWAFRFKNIYEITAVTDRENDKCVRHFERMHSSAARRRVGWKPIRKRDPRRHGRDFISSWVFSWDLSWESYSRTSSPV